MEKASLVLRGGSLSANRPKEFLWSCHSKSLCAFELKVTGSVSRARVSLRHLALRLLVSAEDLAQPLRSDDPVSIAAGGRSKRATVWGGCVVSPSIDPHRQGRITED